MEELMVVTQWITSPDGTKDVAIRAAFNGRCTDMTAQPTQNIMPAPNLVSVRCRCDSANADLIEADPDCYVESRDTI